MCTLWIKLDAELHGDSHAVTGTGAIVASAVSWSSRLSFKIGSVRFCWSWKGLAGLELELVEVTFSQG